MCGWGVRVLVVLYISLYISVQAYAVSVVPYHDVFAVGTIEKYMASSDSVVYLLEVE